MQAGVVKKFLPKKEYVAFMEKYSEYRGGWGIDGRLSKPITKVQKDSLRFYIFGDHNKVAEIAAKEMGIHVKPSSLANCSKVAALKLLYQNKDKIDIEELLKGGE